SHGWKILVQTNGAFKRLCNMAPDHLPSDMGRRIEMMPTLLGKGEGDGGDAEEKAFGSRRDRSGVQGVIAHTSAIIDSGHDEIRPEVEQTSQCDVHAV